MRVRWQVLGLGDPAPDRFVRVAEMPGDFPDAHSGAYHPYGCHPYAGQVRVCVVHVHSLTGGYKLLNHYKKLTICLKDCIYL